MTQPPPAQNLAAAAAPPLPPPPAHFIVIAVYPHPDNPLAGSIAVQFPGELSLQQSTAAVVGAAQQLQQALRQARSGIAIPNPGALLPPPPGEPHAR